MSERTIRLSTAALAALGAAIAGYLLYVRYTGGALACATGGCETVQHSRYAEVLGVPVAGLGLAGFLGLLVALHRERCPHDGDHRALASAAPARRGLRARPSRNGSALSEAPAEREPPAKSHAEAANAVTVTGSRRPADALSLPFSSRHNVPDLR
jgi:hypothetical protein